MVFRINEPPRCDKICLKGLLCDVVIMQKNCFSAFVARKISIVTESSRIQGGGCGSNQEIY